MTKDETKASILAQLNQQALATAVENLAEISVANEVLKVRVSELEAEIAALKSPPKATD